MRALDFGSLRELVDVYGDKRDLEDMPLSQTTTPAVVFKPHTAKRRIVAYDSQKAVRLLMTRDPLPMVFTSATAITDPPMGIIGRNRLVIKSKSAEDIMRYSRSDEG